MEPKNLMENQDSIRDEIHKLSFKDLKELAKQRNINPKLKKAQLVNELLATEESTTSDKTVYREHGTVGRVTRARASILKNVDSALGRPNPIKENELETKTRGKRSKCDKIEEKPLSEITNTDTLLEYNDCLRHSLSVTCVNKLTEKEESFNEDVTSTRRGRKKKNVQESYSSVNTDMINSSEDLGNVGEKKMKPEDINISKNIGNTSDTHLCEPKKPKRGRRGKKENDTYQVFKNVTDISSEKSAENRFSSSKASINPITNNNKATTSSLSETEESLQINLIGENSNTLDKQELLKETSQSSSDVENMPVQALLRSSTFVLDNKDGNPKEGMKRSNTFTLCDDDVKNPNKSLKFTALTDNKIKVTPGKNVKNSQKSIGARILSSSKKLQCKTSARKEPGQGSILKKTITKKNNATPGPILKKSVTKNNATPGSLYKSNFGTAKKAPNFKAIHQKLFENMESLGDNRQRKLERARALAESPVPRCALSVQSPKWEFKKKDDNIMEPSSSQRRNSTVRNSATVVKSRTPVVDKIPTAVPKSASLNRFGFYKKRVNREVANSVVGMKMPPIDREKRKDEDRALIQGVRMNKRFLLQMQMRHNML